MNTNLLIFIITITISFLLFLLTTLIYISKKKEKAEKPSSKIILLIIFLTLILPLFGYSIYYSVSNSTVVDNDDYSKNRLVTIANVLNSYFGPNWILILLIFAILLIIILVLLYFATSKGIEVNDNSNIIYFLYGFGIVITVIIGSLTIFAFQKYKQEQKRLDPYFSDNTYIIISEIVVLSVITIFILSLIIKYILKKKRESEVSNPTLSFNFDKY